MQGIDAGFWNLDVIYPRIGIERYLSLSDVPAFRRSFTGLGLRDDRLLDWAADELERARAPSYAFVVTLTSHDPFDVSWIPSPLDVGSLEGTKAGRYLQAIHWTDAAIGRFVERLRSAGVLDRSILVVYGDHAGLFRSDSGADRLMPHEARTESGWNAFERSVPLLIRLPQGVSAGARQVPGGQIDIAPTLAALLGIDASAAPWLGRNLLDGGPSGTVFFNDGSALSEDLLFISDRLARAASGCFDGTTGDHLPPQACRALAADAELALGVSRDILELDLVPALQSR
jgi:phosphoglycerol transferase MdoB-like AlkP superfamily enzyme